MARILVIDDDFQVRDMMRQILDRAGYEVAEAGNGKEGMKAQRAEPADLVITDIIMPEKEGLETIQELKRDYPDVKIIAISGGGRIGPEECLHLARLLGVRATLTKPFKKARLLETVKDLLNEVDVSGGV